MQNLKKIKRTVFDKTAINSFSVPEIPYFGPVPKNENFRRVPIWIKRSPLWSSDFMQNLKKIERTVFEKSAIMSFSVQNRADLGTFGPVTGERDFFLKNRKKRLEILPFQSISQNF